MYMYINKLGSRSYGYIHSKSSHIWVIHLVLERCCFEAVLPKKRLRPLGVNLVYDILCLVSLVMYFIYDISRYISIKFRMDIYIDFYILLQNFIIYIYLYYDVSTILNFYRVDSHWTTTFDLGDNHGKLSHRF